MSLIQSNPDYNCNIVFALYVFDLRSGGWKDAGTDNSVFDFINKFDTSTGTLEVDSSNTDYAPSTNFAMNVTAISTDTKVVNTERYVDMLFTLTIKDKCMSNELIMDTDLSDIVYYIGVDGTMPITPAYTS